MKKVLIVHGPNLNLLGSREPAIYGTLTLPDIDAKLHQLARVQKTTLETFQSNAEGAIIDKIQTAVKDNVAFIVINPGGLTHTSIALRDALAAVAIPFIEVHLSNVYAREPFRRHSYLSELAVGVISGLGSRGYEYALSEALQRINSK
ncbi:MAG: type II 3-dehydroquinate dehydratase [Burkholderiales bacterium]|nr:type II 3-dehydroquinate dehydratase [Burkholderiales bacterium]